jgi:membrane associated rhomboid family serine protease
VNWTPRYVGPRPRWDDLLTPAIKALLIACTGVFLVQTVVRMFGGPLATFTFHQWLGLVPVGVLRGLRIWQPFTYLFLHGDFWHLFFNMLALWMFGRDLERAWGRRRFLFYYFLTGAGAAVLNVAVKWALYPISSQQMAIPTVGASGAIFGILMAAALMFPDRQVWWFPFPIMLPMRAFVFIMGAIAFFGTLGSGGDTVSHLTHLTGMLVGYLYLRRGTFLYRLRNRYLDWKRRRARRKFEVYMRDHRDEPPSRPDQWVN